MRRDEAFVEFVRARSRSLFRTALLLESGDHASAEDLLQTALVRAYRSWVSVSAADSPEAYVRRIIINASVSRRRRLAFRLEVSTADPPDSRSPGPSAYDRIDDRFDIWEKLRRLSPRQRAVVVLRYFDGLSEREIAEVMNCSQGAVKSHASRAMANLRDMYTDASAEADDYSRLGGRNEDG